MLELFSWQRMLVQVPGPSMSMFIIIFVREFIEDGLI